MSQDEIKNQKAVLVIELNDAEEQLGSLKEKAIRIGREFVRFGELMETKPETVIAPTSKGSHGEVGLNHIHPHQIELLHLDNAISLADELRIAARTVRDLKQRLSNLGVRHV